MKQYLTFSNLAIIIKYAILPTVGIYITSYNNDGNIILHLPLLQVVIGILMRYKVLENSSFFIKL